MTERLKPVDNLVHAIVARAIAWFEKTDEFKVVRRLYPNDERALHILRRSMGELYESRAASVPAGQGGTWGTQVSPTDGYALLASMGPAGGAGAQLFKRSVQLSFGNASALNVPG